MPHFYGNDIADELIAKINTAHGVSLGLDVVGKGTISLYPSIEVWNTHLDAVLINPTTWSFKLSSSVGRYLIDYGFDLLYLRRWATGQEDREVDIANTQAILETLLTNLSLPGLVIAGLEILHARPTEIHLETDASAALADHQISATSIGLVVETAVNK